MVERKGNIARTWLLFTQAIKVTVLAQQAGHVAENRQLADVDSGGALGLGELLRLALQAACGGSDQLASDLSGRVDGNTPKVTPKTRIMVEKSCVWPCTTAQKQAMTSCRVCIGGGAGQPQLCTTVLRYSPRRSGTACSASASGRSAGPCRTWRTSWAWRGRQRGRCGADSR